MKMYLFRSDRCQRTVLLLLLLAGIVSMQACRTLPLEGVKTDTWYVNEELSLALRFSTTSKKITGEYAVCKQAVTEPHPFSARFDGDRLHLRISGGKAPELQGIFHSGISGLSMQDKSAVSYPFVPKGADSCPGGARYTQPVFDDVMMRERIYGHAPGYYSSLPIPDAKASDYPSIVLKVASGVTENLFRDDVTLNLDLYTPEGDAVSQRPLLVLIHGGAFVAGDKRDEFPASLARYYARCGFVVASVNYRMGYVFLPGAYSNLERCMYRGVQDIHAALRFLAANKNLYNIDPDMIFVGGNSAGGFLALFTAFMNQHEAWESATGSHLKMQTDLGRLDASGNPLVAGFRIRGVINMWGAVHELSIIDKFEKIPVLSVHGTADKIVPCGYDYPFKNLDPRLTSFFVQKVAGSNLIKARMDSLGLYNQLVHLKNAGHEPQCNADNTLNSNYTLIRDSILSFMNHELDNPAMKLCGPETAIPGNARPIYYLNGGSMTGTVWCCEGGIILHTDEKSARVCWLSTADKREISCTGTGKQGQVHRRSIVVKLRPDH